MRFPKKIAVAVALSAIAGAGALNALNVQKPVEIHLESEIESGQTKEDTGRVNEGLYSLLLPRQAYDGVGVIITPQGLIILDYDRGTYAGNNGSPLVGPISGPKQETTKK